MSEVTFLILPGGDPDGLPATVTSIREAAGEFLIQALPGPGLEAEMIENAGIVQADPAGLAGGEGFIAFARAGDRLLPGTFETRLLTFSNFPEAGVSIAGHVLTGDDGQAVRTVPAPHPGSLADEILIRRTPEAAAVLVRAEALEPDHLRLLERPFADLIVWSRIAGQSGHQVSGEIAAEVRLDPDRHGWSGESRVDLLAEAVSAAEGEDEAGDSTLRREFLRRLYLAREENAAPFDLAEVFRGKLDSPETAAAVVGDLQWLAERQCEALVLERLRWADGEVGMDEVPPVSISEEVLQARSALNEQTARISQMHFEMKRLEAEVYRRDSIISDLQKVPLNEAHRIGDAESGGGDQ